MRSKPNVTGVRMHTYQERGNDCYGTPTGAVHALISAINLKPSSQPIWEPCCGEGNISRTLQEMGFNVISSDITDQGFPGTVTMDFFSKESERFSAKENPEWIITNPPYRLANQFVRHALVLVPNAALLMRLAYLEGVGRSDIIDEMGLRCVLPFRQRLPMMHRQGWDGPRSSSQMAFAWMIWERGFSGETVLKRISYGK